MDEVTKFLKSFKFSESDLLFLRNQFPNFSSDFFDFLQTFQTSEIELIGLDNGAEFFAKEKVLLLKGNYSFLNLLIPGINNFFSFSTLVCTNSMRMRKIAGDEVSLLEFGLRRAQGPMAGNFASKYSYLGSFDGKLIILF